VEAGFRIRVIGAETVEGEWRQSRPAKLAASEGRLRRSLESQPTAWVQLGGMAAAE
jgi:hypothetical protein